jgi:hypothetical protein
MASSVPRKSQHLYSVLVPTYNERLNIALTCYLLVNALKYATSLSTFLSLSLSLFHLCLACLFSVILSSWGEEEERILQIPIGLGSKNMSSNSWTCKDYVLQLLEHVQEHGCGASWRT